MDRKNYSDVTFQLSGLVTPKARPRFSGGHSYLPQGYRHWKEAAIGELTIQAQGLILPLSPPVEVHIDYSGHARGDSDNLAGSILDALTGAGILADDSVTHVPRLSFQWHKSATQQAGCRILLTPVDKVIAA